MTAVDVGIIGAGPAGIAAGIEAATAGCSVALFDGHLEPGGQLIKQIHRFFGSREHRAGVRGIRIAHELWTEAQSLGVQSFLGWEVFGVQSSPSGFRLHARLTDDMSVDDQPISKTVTARTLILATGAEEKAINFEGWTLPGVMGAGAAQTMANVWRVRPGESVLMIGAGNVGLIVSYHLLQAGIDVAAVLEAAPTIGGYGVHAAKISRAGIPILTSHSIIKALGTEHVTGALIAQVDPSWNPISGTERKIDVDSICIAGGLRSNTRLAKLAGCQLAFCRELGGWLPIHNAQLETTVKGIYVAGDAAGIEEASTAIEEGRIAGLVAARSLGRDDKASSDRLDGMKERLSSLRGGPFCEGIRVAKRRIFDLGEEPCPTA